jgi:group I intron endonuclease
MIISTLAGNIEVVNKYPFILPEDYNFHTRIYCKEPCIYLIKFPNNKIYIGSAIDLRKRIKLHRQSTDKNSHFNKMIIRSINKYGIKDIEIYTLEENISREILLSREQYHLDLYKPYSREIGYNICTIAGSRLGTKQSLETIEKRRKSLIGRTLSKEHKEKISKNRLGKIGNLSNNPRLRPIIQKDLLGNIVVEYDCIADTFRKLSRKNNLSCIGNCLRGRSNTALGYKWEYKNIIK